MKTSKRVLGMAVSVVLAVFIFLFSSSLGLLILSLVLYSFVSAYSEYEPWTFAELVSWVGQQKQETIIAVVGFVVAFWIAVATWQRQKRTELRIEAGREVVNHFLRVIDLQVALEIFAEEFVKLRRDGASISRTDALEWAYRISVFLERIPVARAQRKELSELIQGAHTVKQRNVPVLVSTGFFSLPFQFSLKQLGTLQECIWFLIPEVVSGEELARIVLAPNEPLDRRLNAFVKTSPLVREKMAGAVGGMWAFAQYPMIKPSALAVLMNAKEWFLDERSDC
ncbi:hypothetical protein ABU614_11915 [Lysobacter firmicutimachus]|uniref:Uncharacterized protein n=1 Tax=Lysobacter firmicutimachus TaxID=1792846 RepID=A0AAU8MPA9_9GAMM